MESELGKLLQKATDHLGMYDTHPEATSASLSLIRELRNALASAPAPAAHGGDGHLDRFVKLDDDGGFEVDPSIMDTPEYRRQIQAARKLGSKIKKESTEDTAARLRASQAAHGGEVVEPIGYLSKSVERGEQVIGFRASSAYRFYDLPEGDTALYAKLGPAPMQKMVALPTITALMGKLADPDPVFEAWRDSVPDKHWVTKDLSALRIGYELGRSVQPAPQQARAEGVPAGWKLVPVDPTQEMLAAGVARHEPQHMSRARMGLLYRAMLAASPEYQGGES